MLKRTFDVVAAAVTLVVLSPVMLVLAIAIAAESGLPILYRAERAGRSGKPFRIVKFRSMRPASPGGGTHHSGDDDPRITRVGRFVRRFKLDELPQLVNVLTGHMSFVGPRPETIDYATLYTEEERRVILSARPGITDYASIEFADLGALLSGGDPDQLYIERVWKPKMALRMKYVQEQSFAGDLKLIVRTLLATYLPRRNV